ncbi:MAG TPA: S1 RNA-binding domain-containing protein [Polyangiales bacterium]|nr:S1 RNA-binding domain-containing protein [Polyangiales bacterium]
MNQDSSSDDFASLFEASAGAQRPKGRQLSVGQPCRAEVVQVGQGGVFVEILDHDTLGKRPQGYLDMLELREQGSPELKPGDVIDAVVVAVERSGSVRLGRSMGRPAGASELQTAYEAKLGVEGKVTGVNKGGLEVEVAGQRAFCPTSQIERGYVTDPQSYVGKSLTFLVTELRDGGKRIVLSRRALLEQEAAHARERTLAQLAVGAAVRGTVTALRDFGAFVDLGGVEGLIPTSELSFDRGKKAADVLAPGDVVEVQVRAIQTDVQNKRGEPSVKITLSLKALSVDPWEDVEKVVPIGRVVRGSVTRLADFGAFVQLAPGIEGLLHVSELGGKVAHPSAVLHAGQQLQVTARSIDRAGRKISLALAPDGLDVGADARGPVLSVGSVVSGAVDRIEPFGVFLQIEGTRGRIGRGLIPNAELGVPRGADVRKLFPVGTRLTAKVLETGEGKLRLSVKAIKEDEERADFDGYKASAAEGNKLGTFADLFKKR